MTLERLEDDIAELRLEVTRHPVFFRPWSVETLRTVMTHHVMAVWDSRHQHFDLTTKPGDKK
jgi:hypothetical protein